MPICRLYPYIINVAPNCRRKLFMTDDAAYCHANPLSALQVVSNQYSCVRVCYEVAVEIWQCHPSLCTEGNEMGVGSSEVGLQRRRMRANSSMSA